MRQLFKRALVVAMCLVFLVPTAWGRSKYYRSAQPWGENDGRKQIHASTRGTTVILTWRTWRGIGIPMLWIIKVQASADSETSVTTKRVAKKRGVR